MKVNNKGKTMFLTVGEVADYLNIKKSAVYNAMNRGTMPIYQTFGGTGKLFHIEDVSYYKQHRKPGRPKIK